MYYIVREFRGKSQAALAERVMASLEDHLIMYTPYEIYICIVCYYRIRR